MKISINLGRSWVVGGEVMEEVVIGGDGCKVRLLARGLLHVVGFQQRQSSSLDRHGS
jgi:hypothetical protein